jgi:hypothetical protein
MANMKVANTQATNIRVSHKALSVFIRWYKAIQLESIFTVFHFLMLKPRNSYNRFDVSQDECHDIRYTLFIFLLRVSADG